MAVALITLLPSSGGEPTPFLCLPCGHLGSADAVLNTVLFLPFGVLLGALGVGLPSVAVLGFGIPSAIELAQTALPGRYPTLADIVVNGLGAILGFLIWRRALRGLPPVRTWVALGVGVLGGTAVAALPSPPPGLLYGQYTPRLGSFDAYDGDVLDVRLGGRPVASGPLEDSDEVRALLRRSPELRLSFRVGRPTRGWAPVFAVFSGDREEAVFVGVRDDDLLVRFRSIGGSLRFAEPSMVLYDGLAGMEPGDTAHVVVGTERFGTCISTAVRRSCGLGPGPLQGWRYLRRDLWVPLPWAWVSGGLVATLTVLILMSGPPRTGAWALAALSTLALGLPAVTPLAHLRVAGLVLGLGAGVLAARYVKRRAGRGS